MRKDNVPGRLGIAFAVATCLAVPAFTQQPTFKVSVNVVDVDVTVTDGEGNFVSDLRAEDFEVLEDGKPQTIQTFSAIELPVQRRTSFEFGGRPVPADVRSNRDVESGRVYIILLDDLNVAPLRTAVVRRHARDFIEQHFGPRDLAAVVVTSGRKDAAQEFTNDPALLLRAVDNFFGQRLQSAEMQRLDDYYQNQLLSGLNDTVSNINDPEQTTTVLNPITRNQSFDPSNLERGQRAVGVLNTLESLTAYLEGVRGRRKALLWFSEGLDYPMAEAFSSQSGSEITRATRNAVNAAARANVNVYALDPRGLIGMTADFVDSMKSGAPDQMGTDPTRPGGTPFSGTQALLGEMRLTQDSLRTLAEGTGGFAAVDTNSFAEAYSRIIEANSRYYLLGYAPPAHPRDGRFHRIEVRVKRPGLTAVARRGYPASSTATREERRLEALERWARDRRTGGENDTSAELRAALNSPVQQSGLTLAVQAVAFKGTSKQADVAITVELDGAQLEFAPQASGLFADTLEVSYFALNDDGRPQRGTRAALNLAIKPETYQRLKALGVRLNSRTPLAPGRYQLRVGARDPQTGKAGTAFTDLIVPDFSDTPLMMSGVLVSSAEAQAVLTPQRDAVAEKLLGAPATTQRQFNQTDTLTWLTEIYDNGSARQPRRFDVAARLISEDGRDAFVSRDVLTNGEGSSRWTSFGYTGRIPLKEIAPGRYLLRIEARDRATEDPERIQTAQTVVTVRPAAR
ncbi:MAG: VWA domain-containing protein [Acidobacteria bacterium]|nr:MAG: VWA domain-containing protein [Acidobacteriota bacterium]